MNRSPQAETAPLLTLEGITKRFGPLTANQDIRLALHPGQVHALLGENGAGKSTLMSILAGRYRPDAGTIRLRGNPVDFTSPAQALAMGIGMVYQRFMLVDALSVAENILLGTTGLGLRLDLAAAVRDIEALSAQYGLRVDPRRRVGALSMGERQRVEILKLLYRRADILIFDEPTAILSPPEVDRFFETLQRLVADGRTVVFITHKLEEVLRVADRIAIMRRGRIIAQLRPDQLHSRRELARLMVGREIVLKVAREPVETGPPVLTLKGLTAPAVEGRRDFADIDLEVRRGEITALTGVAGNGQGPLVAALTAQHPFAAGTIRFGDRAYDARSWPRADRRGLIHIPEDRHHTGSVPAASLVNNFILTRLGEFRRGPFLRFGRARRATRRAIARFDIRTPRGPASLAAQLSGGNLQKLILARELGRHPKLIVAEHPTHGLDVSATEAVWQALLRQRAQAGILLVSGDLKEVLSLADRVAVMFRGRILGTIDTRDSDQVARIGLLMAGAGEETRHETL